MQLMRSLSPLMDTLSTENLQHPLSLGGGIKEGVQYLGLGAEGYWEGKRRRSGKGIGWDGEQKESGGCWSKVPWNLVPRNTSTVAAL